METSEKLITENLDVWTSAVKTRSSAGRGSSSKRDLYGFQKLRELILKLAVMGKLVEQDSEDEPASELLTKLREEKKNLIEKKEAKDSGKLHQKAPERPAYSIPDNWEWVRFRELIWCFRGHNPPKSEFIYEPQDGYV
ncbi:restriction endonuclease subunit S, partial [bacterium]|nr:restriction endonuclease subunit S [bacterium]